MPWVAGHLTGGLGNRLFQHAAAAGLAEQWGLECVFYKPKIEPTNHAEADSIYDLFPGVRVIETEEDNVVVIPEAHGACFTYTPWPPRAPLAANFLVDGWRQTVKYFPTTGVDVRLEETAGKERLELLCRHYGLDTEDSRRQTWFVHFRFGDYLQLPHHQIHLGSYYSQALRRIPTDARILVFSDEAETYKSFLRSFFQEMGLKMTIVDEKGVVMNLALMAACWGGAVVANSTFSWWGAYCAHRRTGTPHRAIYPKIWGKGLPPARNVVPDWGIPIENQP